MVVIHIAYSAPINPPSVPADQHLTHTQIWRALERKVRAGQEFVPVITDTEVHGVYHADSVPPSVSVDGQTMTTHPDPTATGTVIRVAHFKQGTGPPAAQMMGGKMLEECVCYAPSRVDFYQPDGGHVQNQVSMGPGGREPAMSPEAPDEERRARRLRGDKGDFYMTYIFAYKYPALDEERDAVAVEHVRRKEEEQAKKAVDMSIEALRRLRAEGKLDG